MTTSFTNTLLTTNTLRFNTAAQTLTLNNTGASTVTGGGILVTSAGTGSIIASGGGSAGLMGRPTSSNELVIHNYADLTISAPIVNNGANATLVTLAGPGSTTLSGANTYSGLTTLTRGTLNVNATGALGTGNLSLFGGTLNNTSGAALAIASTPAVPWGGTFTFGTAASTSLNNLNLGAGAVTVTAGRTLNFAGTGTTLTMGTLTNTGSAGSTWTANGLGNTLVFGGYKITTATGTVAVFGNLAGTANINITGTIENGNLFANGVGITNTGTVTFGGTNTYTGATTLSAGTLSVGTTSNLGAAVANLVFNGGRLQITGTALTNFSGIGHTVVFNAGRTVGLDINNAGHTFTADQVLNQTTGGLIKSGAGTLILNQTNSYTGVTTVSAGTLQIGNGTDAGSITTSGSINNNAALVYNVGSGNRTYSNTISGNGSLTKNGTGTLTLSGTNTYTGDTTVSVGTLAVNGTAIANTNKLVINGGKVAPTGTEVVNTLFFGAVQQASGTWGATDSGAINIDDTRFSGTAGVVSVTTGDATGGYASWKTANAGGQDPSLDFDLDGVSNGVEYFMNAPTGFTATPVVLETAGPVRKVTWTNGGNIPSTAYGTQYVVQTSTDLAIWTDVLVGDSNLGNLTGSVAYTLPADAVRTFVRLSVTPN